MAAWSLEAVVIRPTTGNGVGPAAVVNVIDRFSPTRYGEKIRHPLENGSKSANKQLFSYQTTSILISIDPLWTLASFRIFSNVKKNFLKKIFWKRIFLKKMFWKEFFEKKCCEKNFLKKNFLKIIFWTWKKKSKTRNVLVAPPFYIRILKIRKTSTFFH